MTDKFEIFPQNVTKDCTLIIINKGLKLYNIKDTVDLLNEQQQQIKENRTLKEKIKCYEDILHNIISQTEYEIGDMQFRVCTIVDAKTFKLIQELIK